MPIPVLAGIPWLAAFLGALFGKLVEWFFQWVSKRALIVAGAIAGFVTVTAVFVAGIEAAINGLSVISPPWFAQACSLIVPSNYSQCMGAIVSAHLLRWAYVWHVRLIDQQARN